ncbi:MAG: arylesterase [Gammaproteobacteria bacterium]|nr:arylesterase [Gammaproteobacteria bacterium]
MLLVVRSIICHTLTKLLLCFWLALPAHANNILLLGDSLSASYGMQASEGWVMLAQQQLDNDNQDINLINFSVSGETTAGGRVRLSQLLATHKIDILWIELGGNDGLRGYPIRTIRDNLRQMIKLAQAQKIKVILTQIDIPPNLGRRYLSLFRDIFPTVAKQTQSDLMPFFIKDVVLDKTLMQADGIHPNRAAQPIIAKVVVKFLTQYLSN